MFSLFSPSSIFNKIGKNFYGYIQTLKLILSIHSFKTIDTRNMFVKNKNKNKEFMSESRAIQMWRIW